MMMSSRFTYNSENKLSGSERKAHRLSVGEMVPKTCSLFDIHIHMYDMPVSVHIVVWLIEEALTK